MTRHTSIATGTDGPIAGWVAWTLGALLVATAYLLLAA